MRRRLGGMIASALLTALAVGGCASGDGEPASEPSASSAPQSTAATQQTAETTEPVTVRAAIRDGKVTPPTQRIKASRGDTVRLELTSDVDDEVHVHGYEAEDALEAGRTTTLEFVADQAGVFEIETHEGGLVLAQLEVR